MRYADSFYEVVMTLTDFYVPYSARRLFDGWQIKFPWCSGDDEDERVTVHFWIISILLAAFTVILLKVR